MSRDMKETSTRDRKREQFGDPAGPRPNWAGRLVIVAVAVLLMGLGVWYTYTRDSADERQSALAPIPAPAALVAADGVFRIPLADLASGQAKFFEHQPATGLPVRFLAIKGSDGTHRVALDACEICYAGRQGYQQNGNELLCRKCGRSFPSEVIDDVTGGCHPIRVERATEGTDLVVKTVDLEQTDAKYASAAARPQRRTMPPTAR